MSKYTAPYAIPALYPGWNGLPAGEFLLPVCTTRERMVKLLNALNTYGVLADDKNLDFIVDILRAIKYVPDPQEAPCSDGCGDPKSCVTFYPWHSNFEFFSPGLINGVDDPPPGYAQHPWYTGDRVTLPFFNFLDTDILCDVLSTRPAAGGLGTIEQILVGGLPRFRFTFEAMAAGEALVHLIDVPQGGYALVRLNEVEEIDLLVTQSADAGDLLSLTTLILQLIDDIDNLDDINFSAENIHTIPIPGPGVHTIDVLFLPKIEVPNLLASGWGGGIRKIVICGDEVVCPDPEEDMPRPELRSIIDSENAGCKIIQWKYETEGDTLWRNLATICDGDDGPAGPAGPAGAPGECECPPADEDDRDIPPPTNVADPCALARRMANHVVDAYTIWANDIAYALYTQGRGAGDLAQDMEDFLYSGSTGIFESAITGDSYQFTNSWDFLVSSFFSAPLAGGVFWTRIVSLVQGYQALDVLALRDTIVGELENITCAWVDALDDDLTITQGEWDGFKAALAARMDDAGAAAELGSFLDLIPLSRIRALARLENDDAFNCDLCELEYTWCRTWDFRLSDYTWTGIGLGSGAVQANEYIPGVGWKSSLTRNATLKRREIGISGGAIGSNFTVVAARIVTIGTKGDNAGNLLFDVESNINTKPANSIADWEGTLDRLIVYDAPRPVNRVDVDCVVGVNNFVGSTDPGGEIILQSVTLYGTGTPPNWTDVEEC